jgi:hypothetical protein
MAVRVPVPVPAVRRRAGTVSRPVPVIAAVPGTGSAALPGAVTASRAEALSSGTRALSSGTRVLPTGPASAAGPVPVGRAGAMLTSGPGPETRTRVVPLPLPMPLRRSLPPGRDVPGPGGEVMAVATAAAV